MEEIWKTIPGYENRYEVSNLGRVKSLARLDRYNRHVRERILQYGDNGNGYKFVHLLRGTKQRMYVHRLVAFAWIENDDPETKTIVNHIDGNKSNNVVSNLEWCTPSDNNFHRYNVLNKHTAQKGKSLKKNCKRVGLFEGGVLVREFDSLRDCVKRLGVNYSSASERLHGKKSLKLDLRRI